MHQGYIVEYRVIGKAGGS